MTRPPKSTARSWLLFPLAVIAVGFPLVLVGYAVVRSCEVQKEPEALEEWVEELRTEDHSRIEAAVKELATRGREDPDRVVPALIDAMRAEMHEKYLALGLRQIEHPVQMLVVVDEHDPDDPRHVQIEADGRSLNLRMPRLPIGMWVFGSAEILFTTPDGEFIVTFKVQKEVRDAFLDFTTRHRGGQLAFVAGSEVLWLHTIEKPVADVLRFYAPRSRTDLVVSLQRLTTSPTLSFHDGYTEAGRALALMGEAAVGPLEAVAREGNVAARAAAWARWRLAENLR